MALKLKMLASSDYLLYRKLYHLFVQMKICPLLAAGTASDESLKICVTRTRAQAYRALQEIIAS
jgi:hypothetical protein